MKVLHYFILCLFCLPIAANAQSGGEKVRAAKVSFIADRLQLTAEKSAQFWNVYNQYEDQMRTLRRMYRLEYIKKGGKQEDKSAAAQYINNDKSFLQKKESMRRVYKVKLERIIGAKQYNQLLIAEDDFRDMLLNTLKEKGRFD